MENKETIKLLRKKMILREKSLDDFLKGPKEHKLKFAILNDRVFGKFGNELHEMGRLYLPVIWLNYLMPKDRDFSDKGGGFNPTTILSEKFYGGRPKIGEFLDFGEIDDPEENCQESSHTMEDPAIYGFAEQIDGLMTEGSSYDTPRETMMRHITEMVKLSYFARQLDSSANKGIELIQKSFRPLGNQSSFPLEIILESERGK